MKDRWGDCVEWKETGSLTESLTERPEGHQAARRAGVRAAAEI